MSTALLYCLVLEDLVFKVLEMRTAVIVTAGVSQVNEEFGMPDS